jgi:flagellar capping protein FliD
VRLGSGGLLSIDADDLDEALNNDLDGVVNLLTARFSGTSDSSTVRFVGSNTQVTVPGTYEVEANFAGGTLTGGRMRAAGSSTWHDAGVVDNTLVGAENTPEEGLVVQAVWDGSSTTASATVRVQQGLLGGLTGLIDRFLDYQSGTVTVLKNSNDDVIDILKDRIEREEQRLAKYQQHLEEKFSRLEYTLSQLQSQSDALVAQLA